MFAFLLTNTCQIVPLTYPQDKPGGENPQTAAPLPGIPFTPCSVQQDSGPENEAVGQNKHRSRAVVTVFFAADPGVRVNDRIYVQPAVAGGVVRILVCRGPAFVRSGQSVGALAALCLWEVETDEIR